MRVVITGHNGQLGRQLQTAFTKHETLTLDLPCDDITDPGVSLCISDFQPELVVHAAAFTDVDACEADPDKAYRVNALGTQHVAMGALWAGAPMLYISTNEVFDGSRREPYREWDLASPMSVYARSKEAGEQIVRDLVPRFYIVRLAWLFGPEGLNFVTKILSGAQKHGALRVAADEFGNPTYAPDVASAIARIVESGRFGIYHLTNEGFCSRYDFAKEIMRLAGRDDVPIVPILSSEWQRLSRPPLHAVLANTYGAALGIRLRPWQDALAEYLRNVPAQNVPTMGKDLGG
jgi:dTDP-4-dehydrorhamnose reductase